MASTRDKEGKTLHDYEVTLGESSESMESIAQNVFEQNPPTEAPRPVTQLGDTKQEQENEVDDGFTPQWLATPNGDTTLAVARGIVSFLAGTSNKFAYDYVEFAGGDSPVITGTGWLYYEVSVVRELTNIGSVGAPHDTFNFLIDATLGLHFDVLGPSSIAGSLVNFRGMAEVYITVAKVGLDGDGNAEVITQVAEGNQLLSIQDAETL